VAVSVKFAPAEGVVVDAVNAVVDAARLDDAVIVRLSGLDVLAASTVSPP
jgi:hypothetical protein